MKNATMTIILSLVMLLTAAGIGHAIMEELSLEDLTRGAGTIVIATVDDMEADSVVTSDGGTMIYTFVRLSIYEVLKGRVEDKQVVVRVAGGKIGDLDIRVEDQPKFEKGQRVLVFLKQMESPLSSQRLFEVYGAIQGVREPSEEALSKIKRILEATSSGKEDALFSLEVTTDKPHYEEGEDIGITITAKNERNEEITLLFPSGPQAYYIIDGWFRGPVEQYWTTSLTSVTIPPVESHTWEFVHTSEDTRLDAGIHTIMGLLTAARPVYEPFLRLQATTEITVGDLGKIEGTVLDEHGSPLPDVRIVAYRKWQSGDLEPLPIDMQGMIEETAGEPGPLAPEEPIEDMPFMPLNPRFTGTDENGAFTLEYLPMGGTFLIAAFKKGYDLVWTEVEITSEAVPVEIILSETTLATLTGHVLDQHGDPVSEAAIRGMAYPDFGWLDRFPELPVSDDEWTLREEVDAVESSFGSMEPWRSDLRPWLPLSRAFTAETDADGHFVLEGVPVGWKLSLHAARKGYEPAFSELEMTSDPDAVKLTMTKLRLGRIRGIVMDKADGSPIPEAHIVAIPKWDEEEGVFEGVAFSEEGISGGETAPEIISYPTRFGPWHAVTDENGEFTLEEVNLDMRFVLWAYKEGYDPAHAEVLDPSDDTPYVEIALTKIEMGVLTGIVLNDAGQAVSGAEVLAYPEIYPGIPEIGIGITDGEDAASGIPDPEIGLETTEPRGPFQEYTATTDADGRFVIRQIPVGRTVSVSARKRGYEVAHRRLMMAEKETFVQLYLIAFEDDYPNRNANIRDGLRYEVAMDRMAYNADEAAKLRYRVVNLAEEVKTFSFPTRRRAEFLVLSLENTRDADPYSPDGDWEWPGEVIWRWSEGQEFEASTGEIRLAQGESAAFEGTLDLSALDSDERGFLLLGFLAGLRKESQSYAKFIVEREVPIDAQVTIAGVVTDGEGRPLARANVAARTADVTLKSRSADVERYTAVTDERGRFALKGLYRGGTYEVTAFREGYTPQQKIVYAIQEQNDVRFVLHTEGSGNRCANVSYSVQDGVRIELFTDRHFYAGDTDVIQMCYRITNARETPVAFNFSNGQQVDFVLRQEDRVLWRWSDGRGFIEAETTLELPKGASKAFKTELALASLDISDGNLILSGYLNLPENAEKTRASLELTLGTAYEVVTVGAEDAALGPIQVDGGMGAFVELLAPPGIKGQIEFSEQTRNTLGDLVGYRFLRMVDFRPDPVLSAFVERIYVEIEYDEAQLKALGIETEEAVQLFIWDASGDPPGWRKMEGGVDTERNVAWANVPNMGTQWALFAAEPSAVEEQSDLTPAAFALAQNVPNPFNPATTIRFSIPNHPDAKVALVIYNTMGQRVRTLVEDTMDAGVRSVVWDGRDEHGRMVSSGVYLYRLTAGGRIQTRKMLLIK